MAMKTKSIMTRFLADYHYSKLHEVSFDFGLGAALSIIATLIKTYLFSDIEFAKWLGVLILIDTIFGLVISFRNGSISAVGFGKIIKKLIAYGVVLCMIHILTHFKVQGEKNELFNWFTQVGYAALVVREAISILENTGKVAPGLIPAWILKRLKGFDKTGKPEDLTDTKDE